MGCRAWCVGLVKRGGGGEHGFTLCAARQILLGRLGQERRDGLGVQHVWRRRGRYKGLWWGNLTERDRLEDLDVDGKIVLK